MKSLNASLFQPWSSAIHHSSPLSIPLHNIMVRFIAATSLLSLLSFARAATINARQCKYACSDDSNSATVVDASQPSENITISWYFDASGNVVRECQYNIVSQSDLYRTRSILPLRFPEHSNLATPQVLAPLRQSNNVEARSPRTFFVRFL